MDADGLRRWDLKARERFTYRPDPPGADTWRSRAGDALAGLNWSGDCDDLASTALELCALAGAALSSLYRLTVFTPSGEGHMIAAALGDDGRLWVLGDTFGEIYPAEACPHRPNLYQRMDEAPAIWRDGAPWTV